MARDSTCVYRADKLSEADLIVSWLVSHGINAQVKDEFSIGLGLFGWSAYPRGIEVVVYEPQQAELAARLLAEREAERTSGDAQDQRQRIEATCEDCGAVLSFPYTKAGRVEECPNCGEYVDVPEK